MRSCWSSWALPQRRHFPLSRVATAILTLGGPSGRDTLLEGLRLTRGVYGRRANPCPQKIQWQGQGQQSPRLARRSKGYAGEY